MPRWLQGRPDSGRSSARAARVTNSLVGLAGVLLVGGALGLAWSARVPAQGAELVALQDELPLGLDWEPESYAGRADVRPAIVALGRELFFDGRLSRSGAMSCATCHDPARAFTDGRALVVGDAGTVGVRNTPTLLNRAMGRSQFWDGRARSLEEQALGPILSADEMGLTEALFEQRFGADPRERARFEATFGAAPSLALVARAIAAFEATLVSGASPFDRHEWLGDEKALGPEALRGLALFRGKAGCSACHVGTNFTDEKLHDLGLEPGRPFKTPTLRNVTRTAPYMHDGSLASLEEVVRYYDQGARPHPGLAKEIRPLGLSAGEQGDLVAFLAALEAPIVSLAPSGFGAADLVAAQGAGPGATQR